MEQDIKGFIMTNKTGAATLHREEFVQTPDLQFQGKIIKLEQLQSLKATIAKPEPPKPNRAEKALKAAFGGGLEHEPEVEEN